MEELFAGDYLIGRDVDLGPTLAQVGNAATEGRGVGDRLGEGVLVLHVLGRFGQESSGFR